MVDPRPLSELAHHLGLGSHEHVAIVGGGGKTTAMHALGAQLSGSRVLTCTTKMGHDQTGGLPTLLSPTDGALADAALNGPVVAWKAIDGQKAIGVDPETCDRWFDLVDHVIIEADGSRRRPFKAPADYEPVVPSTTTMMVSVIGADALGRVIADQCHRPLRVAALADCTPYERLSPAAAAAVILHDRGARKELPPAARFAVLISKVDDSSASLVAQLHDELLARESGLTVVVTPHVADPPRLTA